MIWECGGNNLVNLISTHQYSVSHVCCSFPATQHAGWTLVTGPESYSCLAKLRCVCLHQGLSADDRGLCFSKIFASFRQHAINGGPHVACCFHTESQREHYEQMWREIIDKVFLAKMTCSFARKHSLYWLLIFDDVCYCKLETEWPMLMLLVPGSVSFIVNCQVQLLQVITSKTYTTLKSIDLAVTNSSNVQLVRVGSELYHWDPTKSFDPVWNLWRILSQRFKKLPGVTHVTSCLGFATGWLTCHSCRRKLWRPFLWTTSTRTCSGIVQGSRRSMDAQCVLPRTIGSIGLNRFCYVLLRYILYVQGKVGLCWFADTRDASDCCSCVKLVLRVWLHEWKECGNIWQHSAWSKQLMLTAVLGWS